MPCPRVSEGIGAQWATCTFAGHHRDSIRAGLATAPLTLDRLRIAAPDPLVTNFLEADALTSDIAIRPKGSAANCRRSGVVFMRLRQRSADATSVQMGKVELDLYTRRRADPPLTPELLRSVCLDIRLFGFQWGLMVASRSQLGLPA